MAVIDPLRLDHVKRTIRAIVLDAVGDVVDAGSVRWSEQGIPRGPRPMVALSLTDGPDSDTLKDDHVLACEISSVLVDVTAAVPGNLYRVKLNGIPYEYIAGGADTVTDIRNGLIALLNNAVAPFTKQVEPVSAASGAGAGEIVITPTVAGGIFCVKTSPLGGISSVVTVDPSLLATHVVGTERMLFAVDVVTRGGSDTAIELTSRMLARKITKALDLPRNIERTANAGVPVRQFGTTRNLSGLEPGGAVFESRAQFDLLAFASSRIVQSIESIETTDVIIDIGGNTETFTVTQ